MNIEFIPTRNSGRAFNSIRSVDGAIKFRLVRRAGAVTFDADWFSLPVELAHGAYRQIESAWSTDIRKYPSKGDCGGGRACLVLTVHPSRESFWRGFLTDLLSDSNAWVYLRRQAA
jgi:hypothetical protein